MINRLKRKSYFIFILSVSNTVALMMLFFCLNNNSVLAQTTERKLLSEVEIEQQIKAGKGFDAQDGHISAVSLGNLLKKYASQDNKSVEQIYIQNAVIDGKLELISVTIPYQLSLENCTFTDDVDFSYSVFKKSLSLNGSTDENKYSIFNGAANFYKMSVDGDFRVENTKFMSKEKSIHFNYMTITGTFFLYKAELESPFTFEHSVMNEFEGTDVCFKNEAQFLDDKKSEENASFNSISVRGNANFSRTTFKGLANFESADIAKTLEMTSTHFNAPNQDIKFGKMKVRGDAYFDEATFAGGFDMSNVEVDGSLSFHDTQATNTDHPKTFLGMKVDTFVFDPKNLAPPYSLQGAVYRLINPTSEDYEKTLELIEKPQYSHSTFINLEAYYRRAGLMKAADEVFVVGMYKEGDNLGWFKRFLNRFMYVAVGYGKHLERALIWSLFFIVIGCWVFRKKNMTLTLEAQAAKEAQLTEQGRAGTQGYQKKKKANRAQLKSFFFRAGRFLGIYSNKYTYNSLWYSIALFLPIVELEDTKIWTLKPERTCQRLYMRVHIILGYLLIPIGLAAWTGLIK